MTDLLEGVEECCHWEAPMVRLGDVSLAPSDSAAWQLECEARYALRLEPGRRTDFLVLIRERRGQEAHDELRKRMFAAEAAFVLDMETKGQRQAYLARVEQQFGMNARKGLEHRILALHKLLQSAHN